jgi:catechol 2,3-dioxygenase-like lactoylglutathione lyase family enzyme
MKTLLRLTVVLIVAMTVSAARRADTARPALTGIDHVVFRTSSPLAAQRFYGDLLGLSGVAGGVSGGTVGTDGRASATTAEEWTEYTVNARQHVFVVSGLPAGTDERLDHVAFATTDLTALGTYLRDKGLKVDGPKVHTPCGIEGLRVTDPEGHTIEFVHETEISSEGGSRSGNELSSRLLHAGVTVRNEAAANGFYHDILGMTEIWRGGFDYPAKTNWVNLRLPESADYLEYMLRDGPSNRRQLGVDHHICLVVPDIQAAWEQVRTRTAAADRAKLAPPQIGKNDKWQINLYDPDGTRVELMEPYNVK